MALPHNRTFRATPLTGLALFLLGSTLLLGCGSGGAGSVSGKVTFKGQAVTGGSLTFTPVVTDAVEAGKPAAADVGADGSYSIRPTLGKNRITYSAPSGQLPDRELKPGEAPPQSPYQGAVPKQPEVEVKSGSNTIDIELVRPGAK